MAASLLKLKEAPAELAPELRLFTSDELKWLEPSRPRYYPSDSELYELLIRVMPASSIKYFGVGE